MEKRKRWHLWLIVAVLALTVYNVLPTIFYYAKPLKEPVNRSQAEQVADGILTRVQQLENQSLTWTKALAKHLHLKPESVEIVEGDPGTIKVVFPNEEQARTFAAILPRAGALIPFVPSQLSLADTASETQPNTLFLQRNIDIALQPSQSDNLFLFSAKRNDEGGVADLYATIIYDRAVEVGTALAGVTEEARLVEAAPALQGRQQDAPYLTLAQRIVDYARTFGVDNPITQRYYKGFTQSTQENSSQAIAAFTERLDSVKQHAQEEVREIEAEINSKKRGTYADPAKQQLIASLTKQIDTVEGAQAIIRQNRELFTAGAAPIDGTEVLAQLDAQSQALLQPSILQRVEFGQRNPFFKDLAIDWERDQFTLELQQDVAALLTTSEENEETTYRADKLRQLIINEIAYLGRVTGEKASPIGEQYVVSLSDVTNSQSFLALKLGALAEKQAENAVFKLRHDWIPESQELQPADYPIMSYKEYTQLPEEQNRLGFVVYAPAASESMAPEGFRPGSIYVVARGLGTMLERAGRLPGSEESQQLVADVEALTQVMRDEGYFAYTGTSYGLPEQFRNDVIFELDDFYSTWLNAAREQFSVHGTKRFATLEFSDWEQRIRALNQIETEQHEDLLKWRDEYRAAQVALDPSAKLYVPKPTQNAVWDNIKLSASKYFRGDDRKILKWGLDLSGGKTVTIGLRDQNGQPVTNEADLRVASNELYQRVNKMGVSEVEIRIEGSNIVLNFPGAQNWSANELIKASTMTFHIANEKFSPNNPALAGAVNQFLQEVWNEAAVTNRKDVASLNEIAWQHLGENFEDEATPRPRSEAARTLLEAGLRLAGSGAPHRNSNFDDSLSTIGMWRVEDMVEQQGGHPLAILFNNYVLEGSSLRNVQPQYDPSKGNVLIFDVASSVTLPDGTTISPSSDFYLWTSEFAEDRIAGTVREQYSGGQGWRMAVVLNDQIISAPRLNEALRNHAMISGSFSQREVNQLAADLKAGSLSFTPKILSEQSVSPELGLQERSRAISAALIGLCAVFALMIGYYRFAGVVASCAVLINLLIMWGILQNLEAALTLPGIAGVILAVGMSVDANVLVFERVREEFAQSGRIASAIQAGYRKAFSAIIDSNVTTIIAALILMNFDSGPIKGFAVTLIVGIVSSMFTALFMTRYYFAGWVLNPKHKELKMANLFKATKINFLSKARLATLCSAAVIAIGLVLLFGERNTILGMDFTGGYAITVELEETPEGNYRVEAYEAFDREGVTAGEVQIRELNRPNHLRIQLGAGLEEPGHPFFGLPVELEGDNFMYPFQANPRIDWVVNALQAQGLVLRVDSLDSLQDQWTAMSGQFSDAMRNAAILGLGFALLCILFYITFRFEFKYAASAIIALGHDILITVGAMAILHKLGVPIQIDLQAVGALMTIVGYSLNDTIIVFDRIREDSRIYRKMTFPEMINHALNVTLNRTLMTSGTTLLVLLALVFLGGNIIFGFALVMTMGVIFGTFSSLFIASPILLYFHRKEEVRQQKSETTLKRA